MKAAVIIALMTAAVTPWPAAAQAEVTAQDSFIRSAAICDALMDEPSLPNLAQETEMIGRAGLELMETSVTSARERRIYAPEGWMLDGATVNVERAQAPEGGLVCTVILVSQDTKIADALIAQYRNAQGWRDQGAVKGALGFRTRQFQRSAHGRMLNLYIAPEPFVTARYEIDGTH